jgi:hypothetical protein
VRPFLIAVVLAVLFCGLLGVVAKPTRGRMDSHGRVSIKRDCSRCSDTSHVIARARF